MKTLKEALEIGESIDIEFKSWIKAHNMKERISLAVDELIAFANCKGGTVYLGVEDNCDVTGCTGKYDIQAIIDDGLFIYESTVVAGVSAKRDATKIGAIKTALFQNEDIRNQVVQAIRAKKPSSILVLGTSIGMTDKIIKCRTY